MIKIAIVEDNATTREVLKEVVEQVPEYVCVGVYDTAEAALRSLPKRLPDVLLMDIQLPSMSGIECVGQLKKMFPEMLVIMVTVYEDPDRIFSALRAGASGYLLKRTAPEEIIAAIREVSSGGGPMSGEIARKVIEYFGRQMNPAPEVECLTFREKEVLDLLANGFSNKEISSRLFVTVDTVRWHLNHIYSKLHVHSRTEAILKYHGPSLGG